MSSTCQLVADALARLHKALSKKVTLEKAACSNYFVEVYSRGVTVLHCVKDTYPNLEAVVKFNIHKAYSRQLVSAHKDKKKLGTLLGHYHSMSLSEAWAIAEEVAAASQSNAIIVDDKGEPVLQRKKSKKCTHEASAPKGLQDIDLSQNHKHLCLNIVDTHKETDSNMDVNNEVPEAGTASDTQSAETSHSCSSPKPDIEDGSPAHSASEASDESSSFHTGTGFIVDFAQEPDYQYFFGVPAEPDNHCNDSSIPPNEGVFIMDPLKTKPAYLHQSFFMALPSGEVPPSYTTTSGATSSPGTCMLIVDMGNPFEERGWHQRMIVTPHHGIFHPLLTPEHSPHLFQFPFLPKVCQLCQVSMFQLTLYVNALFLISRSFFRRETGCLLRSLKFAIFALDAVKCFSNILPPFFMVVSGMVLPSRHSAVSRMQKTCLVLNPISDHGSMEQAQWENPLAMELLESIASESVTKLSSLPIPALCAMMNFHCVEYLHNIELAHLYAQCAEASHSICDQALANLTTKISIEVEHIDPPIPKFTTQVSGNIEMSSLNPPEPPLA
ncbi:hypothetical protein BT96DRAFT_948860 [Gymnopus androsaceus JB14]|uniref:Uncharacterized protein n=1 Tax=Gymnopus androsaceus JB14 TaxID=1447944 RepID=A0A6A4GMU4_9AGAR|nr:hypothetical protein BT96DRAFT_948860 [Gymnopus androsaceus JB14]